MIRATERMMRAAMNAADMPDESNAWAAVTAVLDEILRNDDWLIWSRKHHQWWKAFECGYTGDTMCAGRYTESRATEIQRTYTLEDRTPSNVAVRAPSIARVGDPALASDMLDFVNAAIEQAIRGVK